MSIIKIQPAMWYIAGGLVGRRVLRARRAIIFSVVDAVGAHYATIRMYVWCCFAIADSFSDDEASVLAAFGAQSTTSALRRCIVRIIKAAAILCTFWRIVHAYIHIRTKTSSGYLFIFRRAHTQIATLSVQHAECARQQQHFCAKCLKTHT